MPKSVPRDTMIENTSEHGKVSGASIVLHRESTGLPCTWRVTLADIPLKCSRHTITVPLVVVEAVVLNVEWRVNSSLLPGTGSLSVRTAWNVTPLDLIVLVGFASRSDGRNTTWFCSSVMKGSAIQTNSTPLFTVHVKVTLSWGPTTGRAPEMDTLAAPDKVRTNVRS